MKKQLYILLLILFYQAHLGFAQLQLSPDAEISLLTCSPGTEIYALFGHSAVRVKDSKGKLDLVFNYGIFDYNTPNFTMKFVQGKLLYKLGVEKFRRFLYQYTVTDRQVIEQVFNFNTEEKQKVFDFLINNAKPENASYKYDFFYDNCASRIYDVLKEALGDDVNFDIPEKEYISYRNHLDYYIAGNYSKSPWTDFGMDLILGIPADEIADFKGETYLPDHLSKNLTFGKLRTSVSLLQKSKILIPKKTPESIANWNFPPLLLFWILCGIAALLFLINNNTFTKVFDFLLFLILGLSGVLFVFMWVATDHEVCHKNLNMLWMNPFHILLAINILRNNLKGFWKKYLLGTLVINVVLIVFWKILPQEFHSATFPIILVISMRIVTLLKNKK